MFLTLIELIWTITPAVILILIAFPSFKLLYLMDEVSDPSMSVLAEGLGGPKPYILNKMVNTWKGQRTCNIFIFNNFQFRTFHNRMKAGSRIGPHDQDVISVVIGSLLAPVHRSTLSTTVLKFKITTNYRRSFSTQSENKTEILNPNWISGFTDGEGTFMVSILKSKDRAIGWKVTPIFAIKLSDKDTELLLNIKSFFGVGNLVFSKSSGSVIYSVKSVNDLNSVIIPHFCKYPLLTQKQADFLLFKNIVEFIIQKQHLTLEGLRKIVEYKNVLNKGGLPIELAKAFPVGKSLIERPTVSLPENINIHWFVGFIDAEGCFYVNIVKDATKIGYSVKLNFNLTQHIRDVKLFNFLNKWLDCGNVYEIPKDDRVNLVLTKFNDIVQKLLPILNKYSLHGVKKLNYDDFLKIVKLIENKEHLMQEGLEKIRLIKSGMNTGRSFIDQNGGSKIWPPSCNARFLSSTNLVKGGSFIQKREFHNRVKPGKKIGPHNIDILSVIIGSLLGNSGKVRRSVEGTRICYRQSSKHKEYLFWLYSFFYNRGYCSNLEPRMSNITVRHKGVESIHLRYEFNTFTFRSFNWVHEMFYHKGKKVIKADLENYMTPLCLAIWISDDGCWAKPGVRIATNCFSLTEVELLVRILGNKFNLDCTIQTLNPSNNYSIYIKGSSIPRLREILLPHIHPSMKYKLGL